MSSLLLKSRRIDDVVILDLGGRITIGDGTILLRDAIRKLINGGDTKLLVNLERVDYIDSAGLGEFVSAFATISSAGGQVKLLNLTKRIRDLLQITKLLTVFEAFDNETTALKSMR